MKKVFLSAIALAMLSVPAAMKAQEDLKFMRSSIYTILVNSEEQNTRLDKEAMDVDPEGYAETLKAAGISSLGVLPKQVFPTIAIPEQFYDHNLSLRVLDFDEIITGITPEQAKEARPKGGGFKKGLTAVGGVAMATASGLSLIHI